MHKVYTIILNWNRATDTLECLKSLDNLTKGDYEQNVVVVDNASTDDSLKKISSIKPANFTMEILKNSKNLGFSAGNNVGIKNATKNGADFIFFLNNDTEVHNDLLNELLQSARKNQKVAAFSPKIYFAKGFEFHKDKYKESELGKVLWSAGGSIDWNNVYGINRGVDEVDKNQFDSKTDIEFATGAALFVRANVFKKINGFNEKYFMYYEDTDLCVRIKKLGLKIMYVPKAIVWHKVAQSSGIGSGLNDYFISRNRLLFGFKFASLRTRLALLRESLKIIFLGRTWQVKGVVDFYLMRFGKGSWS